MFDNGVSTGQNLSAVDRIVEYILAAKRGLTRSEVQEMIKERIAELEGLIDEEAAALLVAKELGVALPFLEHNANSKGSKLLIKDLIAGLKRIKISARIVRLPPPLQLSSGKKLQRIVLADESGCINAVAWNSVAETIASSKLKPGDCVLIKNASVREYRGRSELVLSEEAEVERLESCDTSDLEKLAERCNVEAITMVVHEIVEGSKGYCVYGMTRKGPACVLVQAGHNAPRLQRGDVIFVQDPKRLPSEFQRYKLTGLSRIFVLGSETVKEGYFKVVQVEEVECSGGKTIGVRGRLAAALPSKRGPSSTVIIIGSSASTSILTFDNDLAAEMRSVKPGTPLEITGVYASKRGLRLNPFYNVRKIGWEEPSTFSDTLAKKGYVRCRATVLSAVFRLRLLEKGEPLLGTIINLDDGTARARLLTSYNPHIQELIGANWDEIREYASLGVLPQILSFCEEQLKGVDCEVEGWLSRDGVLAASSLKVV
jgi:DNA/RNA endonuclease YhcR with UshA esterase domain